MKYQRFGQRILKYLSLYADEMISFIIFQVALQIMNASSTVTAIPKDTQKHFELHFRSIWEMKNTDNDGKYFLGKNEHTSDKTQRDISLG